MHCNVTLAAEEFKTIHNAVCDLDSICHSLEDVLRPELYLKLVKARNNIRKGLEGAYQQERRDFDVKNEHYEQVKQELELRSIWSIYEVEELAQPHPYGDVTKVVYKDHWGDRAVECQVNGLTWAALYVAADACIRDSEDGHHVFIERFKPSKEQPGVLLLQTGS